MEDPETKKYFADRDISPDKTIFYVSGSHNSDTGKSNGATMADNFQDRNPDYVKMQNLFETSKFAKDFKFADAVNDPKNAAAASEAYAKWAKNAVVFNLAETSGKFPFACECFELPLEGTADRALVKPSFWELHEYKNMYDATSIIEMKDNGLTLADAKGQLAIPPRPAGC
jgi:hypothetical protein